MNYKLILQPEFQTTEVCWKDESKLYPKENSELWFIRKKGTLEDLQNNEITKGDFNEVQTDYSI
jgi:hypothetical protein